MGKEKSSFIEKLEAEVVRSAENYVVDKVKKKIIRISEISVFVVLGLFLISFGLAMVVGYYFPVIDNGINFLIIGILFLMISFFLRY